VRHEAKVWGMKSRPIRLKARLAEAGIRQVELARALELSRSLINTCCQRGYIPPSIPGFEAKVEGFLKKRRIACTGIWQFDRGAQPGRVRMPRKLQEGRGKKEEGRNDQKEEGRGKKKKEVTMNFTKEYLSEEEIRHFVLEGDPFFDLSDYGEIYKSPQLKVVERRFFETIKRHGIMAIVGEVGSGKSTLLRHIIGRLMKDRSTRMIMPDSIDRERLTGGNITQSVISQLGCTKMPRTVVERDKMAKQMLEESVRTGADPVLVIDEAHDLKPEAIIGLKRLWDSGMIFKLLSVIIIGQGGEDSRGAWGLKGSLLFHNQLKEFSERCYLVDLGLMNGSMSDYLDWRFSRVGGKVRKCFTDDALKMLVKKAAQPQVANNVAMRAMKLAFRDGALQVTKEHIADVMNQFEV
jgi:type II secretory pathway predicted ATPase ExeA